MARLSTIDAVWLNAEGDGPPYAIGAVVVLAGPAPTIEELRSLLAERTAAAERMRQRLVPDPMRIRQPEWQDTDVDYAHHVRHVPLDDPSDEGLDAAISELQRRRLDHERPLWDMTMYTGLSDDRWALASRLHHSVADGEGALLLTGRVIDADEAGTISLTGALEALVAHRNAAAAQQPDVSHDDANTDSARLIAEAAKRGGDLALRALRTVRSASAVSEAVANTVESVTRTSDTWARQLPGRPGVLAGDPGDERVWVSTSVDFSDVRRIRVALGGTINDVVMTLMSGGYRALLDGLGLDPDERMVRVLIPVSLRTPGDLASNNQVSSLLVELPLKGDAKDRFTRIRERIDAVKHLETAALAAPVYEAIDRSVPAFVQTFAVRTFAGSGSVFTETLVTNVPGPQFPVYVAGRRALAMIPIIPVGAPWRLNTGVVSYDGTLHFGITAGEGLTDYVHLIPKGIGETMSNLMELASD